MYYFGILALILVALVAVCFVAYAAYAAYVARLKKKAGSLFSEVGKGLSVSQEKLLLAFKKEGLVNWVGDTDPHRDIIPIYNKLQLSFIDGDCGIGEYRRMCRILLELQKKLQIINSSVDTARHQKKESLKILYARIFELYGCIVLLDELGDAYCQEVFDLAVSVGKIIDDDMLNYGEADILNEKLCAEISRFYQIFTTQSKIAPDVVLNDKERKFWLVYANLFIQNETEEIIQIFKDAVIGYNKGGDTCTLYQVGRYFVAILKAGVLKSSRKEDESDLTDGLSFAWEQVMEGLRGAENPHS